MNDIMAVLLDGVAQLEYDRGKALPAHQALYLDKMDEKMEEGIKLGEEFIIKPDISQRAQFVAANLAHAILENNSEMSIALCSYLAVRLPDLKQLKIVTGPELSLELVFDEAYTRQVAVKFFH